MKTIRLAFILALLFLVAGCATAPLAPVLDMQNVRLISDQQYYFGEGADPVRHLLDIYLPKSGTNWPTVLILHGGAWIVNDKSVIGNLGYALANAGVAAVCANYRLYPQAKHPQQVNDLTRALHWTRMHLIGRGADTDNLFIIGYSAGAPLAALTALDPGYLWPFNLNPRILRGVITISGVYDVKEIPWPLRFVFTSSPQVWKKASPILHVRGDAPPFLILHAQDDITLTKTKSVKVQSRLFYEALKRAGTEVSLYEIPDCNHDQVVEQAGRRPDSETFGRIMEFINVNKLSQDPSAKD